MVDRPPQPADGNTKGHKRRPSGQLSPGQSNGVMPISHLCSSDA
jgi:hypothetical protein